VKITLQTDAFAITDDRFLCQLSVVSGQWSVAGEPRSG
jgi:hypothetical protein